MRLLLIALFAMASLAANAGVYVYSGIYQGRDLYVKNPFSADGVGFCVFEVKVNGELTTDEVNSSAFAIDLAMFELNIGDPIEVVIRIKDDCEPRVINPEDISPRSTFEVENISVSGENKLSFVTSNEGGPLPFTVEQFKWNKWVEVATINGKGDGGHQYEVDIRFHEGVNTFRVKQRDAAGTKTSDKVDVDSSTAAVSMVSNKIYDKVEFSAACAYEVFDEYGVLVTKGNGPTIDASSWGKGQYFVNYGKTFGAVVMKK
ncbi:MAG: hypothetical protein MK081_06970 [Flavobacteriales bacterium]|nr:hypothetical protein [Flavobacteriales bacterium]